MSADWMIEQLKKKVANGTATRKEQKRVKNHNEAEKNGLVNNKGYGRKHHREPVMLVDKNNVVHGFSYIMVNHNQDKE